MFVLCFSLALTVISTIGVFDTETIGQIEITEINQTLATGIAEIDTNNITASEDAADAIGGTSMLTQMYRTFKTMLGMIFMPYTYLTKELGVPSYLATPVQVVFNATFIWATIQFITGRSTKSSD